MPVKWDDGREKRLLLEVIAISNPIVDYSAWESVAVALGGGVTAEACRQKFQGIKRTLKTPTDTTAPSHPKAAKANKPKPKTPASGAKGRKRKAADANTDDDGDEEYAVSASKAKKVKKEANGAATGDGIEAELFKAEDDGEGVDLERDDLYDDAA